MAAVLLTAQDVRPRPMAHGNGADSPQIVKRVPWVTWTCSGRCGTRLWGARKAGDCPNRPQAAGTMCTAMLVQWQSVASWQQPSQRLGVDSARDQPPRMCFPPAMGPVPPRFDACAGVARTRCARPSRASSMLLTAQARCRPSLSTSPSGIKVEHGLGYETACCA